MLDWLLVYILLHIKPIRFNMEILKSWTTDFVCGAGSYKSLIKFN